ncbi:hypothetical protein [Nannocystis pusilla]|uniref:hypothetical protein n=1 Tax=Nannocystis pusilla TaxID=889268 RepID=UPI003B7C95D6
MLVAVVSDVSASVVVKLVVSPVDVGPVVVGPVAVDSPVVSVVGSVELAVELAVVGPRPCRATSRSRW